MANSILSSDYRETILVKESKDRWVVKDGVWLLTDLGGFSGDGSTATDRDITVAGHISAGGVGIDMGLGDKTGGSTSVWVTATGTVHGSVAIALKGGKNLLSNLGEIGGKTFGIVLAGVDNNVINEGSVVANLGAAIASTGSGFNLVNSGVVSGKTGVESLGDDTRINNAGQIFGTGADLSGAAVWFDGATSLLTNSGTISASTSLAIRGGAGNETIDNTGEILGAIQLGDGNDVITNTGGSITGRIELGAGNDIIRSVNGLFGGTVYGGAGDDLYMLWGSSVAIVEFASQGIDTIQADQSRKLEASVENLVLLGEADINGSGNSLGNTLTGNSGANRLNGKGGDDFIIGGEGADILIGGAGIDTVSYGASDTGVHVFLFAAKETGRGGDAEGDWLVGIENLIGSAFDDDLSSGVHGGVIDGGRGSDYLNGYGTNNVFTFALDAFALANHDRIDRFDPAGGQNGDKIKLDCGAAFDTFAEIKAVMVKDGKDIVIEFTQTDTLRLLDTKLSDVDAADFLFA